MKYLVFSCFILATFYSSVFAKMCYISSQTALYPADIYIKMANKLEVTRDDLVNGKTRTDLGVGEKVTLKFCEGSNKGKVTWACTRQEDNGFVSFIADEEDDNIAEMTVSSNLKKDEQVTVTASNAETGESAEIMFSLKIPNGFRGEHISTEDGKDGTVITFYDENKNPLPLGHGDIGAVGAAVKIKVNVFPTNVNFGNAKIIEKANDDENLKPEHKPNPNSIPINKANNFNDRLGYYNPIPAVRENFIWKCSWCLVKDDGTDGVLITGKDIMQSFSFEKTTHHDKENNAVRQGVKTKIDKFGCWLSRDSATGEYQFGPIEK